MAVILITGATSGIGLETALEFAKRDDHVILAGRNRRKIDDAIEKIAKVAPKATLDQVVFDLSEVGSVLMAAIELKARFDRIDILINNAGVMAIPMRMETNDGFESQFATNHLGHFVLTAGLYDLLLESNSPRVVTVSSMVAKFGTIDFDDLNANENYSPWKSYSQSKLANLLFARELSKRAMANSDPIISLSSHPGYSATNLSFNGPRIGKGTPGVLKLLQPLIAQRPCMGARPSIMAATSSIENWTYFGPRGPFGLRGKPTVVSPPPKALDDVAGERLWNISEEMTKTTFGI
ncbi:oxidoreductase [Acidithrix sp. C25]|uniref:oxidoreductase n=1 Tax=Acidithrix sp. C25 TaxID=1671482 RepID=UPI00191B9D60|nr:oxidoreductase [Acidithrix sp. C25]CAG4933744.1 unnamed protein product [Acidithrix sp. C25]